MPDISPIKGSSDGATALETHKPYTQEIPLYFRSERYENLAGTTSTHRYKLLSPSSFVYLNSRHAWLIFRKAKTDRRILSSLKCFPYYSWPFLCFKMFCLSNFLYCYRILASKIDMNHKLTNSLICPHLYLNVKLVKNPNGSKFPYIECTMIQTPKTFFLILKQCMPSPFARIHHTGRPWFSPQSIRHLHAKNAWQNQPQKRLAYHFYVVNTWSCILSCTFTVLTSSRAVWVSSNRH